jgi:hypothetical protein
LTDESDTFIVVDRGAVLWIGGDFHGMASRC